MFAGWDGGGTKTRVVCLSEGGGLFAQADFGSLNPNGSPESEVRATVSRALQWMAGLGECCALAVSVAGVSNPQTATLLYRLLAENGYHGPLRLAGDQESALCGAVGEVGAVLVAGTGSVCFGKNADGQIARCGGYGYLVDDEGSGYAIGRDILSTVLRARDGRIPSTRLSALVSEQPGWEDFPALMQNLYNSNFEKSKVAALAPLAIAAGDDAAAQQIILKASRELTLLATTVIDQLHLENERLAFTGSILEHMLPVRTAVSVTLQQRYPRLQGFEPLADAAYGAACMAMQLYRKESELHA